MTSEEIKATIGRLRECDNRTLPTIFDAFTCSLLGNHWCNNDVIEAIVALLEQADPDTHMELPVDADGVPIHVGDEMFDFEHNRVTVKWVYPDGYMYFENDGYMAVINPHLHHHYHKSTVEDVLREMIDEVQRCCDTEDTITEYAAKLREVMVDE